MAAVQNSGEKHGFFLNFPVWIMNKAKQQQVSYLHFCATRRNSRSYY
jgi:hypothetical protein